MTIELLVKYKDPARKSRLIPIATIQLYRGFWEPIAKQRGFKWLEMLDYGLHLNLNDVVEVRDEVIELEKHALMNPPPIDEMDSPFILRRLRFIVEALTEEIEHWDDVAEIIA